MPMPIRDLSGHVFGKLTVIEIDNSGFRPIRWLCRCECGNMALVRSSNLLKQDGTKSCGCKVYDKRGPRPDLTERNIKNAKYIKSSKRTLSTWKSMTSRCLNEKDKDYKNYGGRGIKVCKRWSSFFNFLDDMGERPKGMTIDRIDTNGDYKPENCRWATPLVQANNRRDNQYVEYNGEVKTVRQWAESSSVEYKTLLYRVKAGWNFHEAITTPSLIRRK